MGDDGAFASGISRRVEGMVGWEEGWFKSAASMLRALADAQGKPSNLGFIIISQIFIK